MGLAHARGNLRRMDKRLHIELVTETYPPDVNGVALTVQSLEHGLRGLGHAVARGADDVARRTAPAPTRC